MAEQSKVSISTLRQWKREGRKFAMVTCYDYSTARIVAESGIDSILVGDTYGEVCLGHANTLGVTLEHLLTVTEAVRRGAPSVFLVGDMPFLSYQICPEEAIRNAGRFLSFAGCDCVKVEVDRRYEPTVARMAGAGIPVMAHLGLRPQSIQSVGGYRVQGKRATEALGLLDDAAAMERAGAVALLLEAVPVEVAQLIAESTTLPVVGIVAGLHCDGQVVVMHDMLGYGGGHPPRSVRPYAQLHSVLRTAFAAYAEDVHSQRFPGPEHGVSMEAPELSRLRAALAERD